MNVEHRTLNVQHRIRHTVNLKIGDAKRNRPSEYDSAESIEPESFNPKLTIEELVAGCDSLVLKSIKRSANNIRRSMLDVRCSLVSFSIRLDARCQRRRSCERFKITVIDGGWEWLPGKITVTGPTESIAAGSRCHNQDRVI